MEKIKQRPCHSKGLQSARFREDLFAVSITEFPHVDASGRNQKQHCQTKPREVVHRTIFEVGEQFTITFRRRLDPFCKPRFLHHRDLPLVDLSSQSGP